jgi:hypothetical protein
MATMPTPRGEIWRPLTGPGPTVVQPWTIRHAALTGLLGLAVAGDFANFYITLSVVADEYPVITIMVVLALTAAAIAMAHAAGTLHQGRRHHPPHQLPLMLGLVVGCWLLLGLLAAVVRWFAPASAAASTAEFGVAGSAEGPSLLVPHLTSLLLLGLYLASGVLAAWIACLDHDPHRAATRTAWRRLVWTGFRNRRRQASVARAQASLERHLDRERSLAANHAAALADRAALAEELKAHTRLLIAASLGDPAATSGLAFPRPIGPDR